MQNFLDNHSQKVIWGVIGGLIGVSSSNIDTIFSIINLLSSFVN